MKVGILGTGMIVKALMKTIDKLNFSYTVVLGTKETEEETAAMCREHGLDGYFLDYDELLASDVDTIYVALPNHLHAAFAKKALLHDKHVIIEKPITSNAAQLKDLIETAKEHHRMIFEAMNIHYLPIFGQLKEHLSDLGPIKIVSFNYSQYSSRYDAFKRGEVLAAFDPKRAGGALMDINVYNIHAAVGLFGRPESIRYEANVERDIDTSGIMTMDYGKFKLSAIGAKDCKAPVRCTIQGTEGCIVIAKPVNQMESFELILNDGTTAEYKTEHPDHSKDVWKEIPGVQYVEDVDDILKDEEIQVVILSTPHDTHYPLAKRVLEAGKNCVSEKPFTETKEQAEELFALAKKKGLMMQCYQNRRFDSDFLTAQKVIESGRIGDVTEVEISFDYYRPEVPQGRAFHPFHSFLYGHACHTLDQVISYFGVPDRVQYDVRQLLGEGKMNDYFDIDLFYGTRLKATVKSSYFRVKARPAFTVYGMKGMFVKEVKDKQEEHLKMFYMPGQPGFGEDKPSEYGTLIYMDDNGIYHEEKVPTVTGDYGRYYDALYETVMNGKEQLVKPLETITQIEIMENGIKGLK